MSHMTACWPWPEATAFSFRRFPYRWAQASMKPSQ